MEIFARLLQHKAATIALSESFKTQKTVSVDGYTDIATGGNTSIFFELLRNKPIPVYREKSQALDYVETKVIEQLYSEVGEHLYAYLHFFDHSHITGQKQGADWRQTVFLENIGEIQRIIDTVIKEAELPDFETINDVQFSKDLTTLTFDSDQKGNFFLDPAKQAELIKNLKEKKEIYLSYFHAKPYTYNKNGRPGFMERPPNHTMRTREDIISKGNEGEQHGVVLVDVIFDRDGRIEYLVTRNSWGLGGRTDNGHNYLHASYLHHYGEVFTTNWTFFPAN